MNVILFDIDGTLLVTNRAGSTAMHAALLSEFQVEQPVVVDFAGRADRGIIAEFFEQHEIELNDESVARFTTAYLRELPLALAQQGGSVLPGVADLLAHTAEREDTAIGLLTGNLRAGAMRKLGHFELDHHFAFGGFGDSHVERDDVAREAFDAAVAHVGKPLEAERVIVIGDTVRDITCARSIGAKAIAVATGSHSYEMLAEARPDVLVKDLSAFEFILELIES
jgi:phosphoglycolate phosphatase-like HAD superfamily hydrolase